MSVSFEAVSEKIYNILKGYGFQVNMYDKEGQAVIDPQESTRFAVGSPNVLVRLDRGNETLVLATSEELNEEGAPPIREMLKNLAQDYLLSFDYQLFGKKIKPAGEKIDIQRNKEKEMAEVMETKMFQVRYLPNDSDNFKIEKGFTSRAEASKWIKGENLHDRAEEVDIESYDEGKKVTEASLGSMSGSSKTSYQQLENVRVIVRHKKEVNEESRGARSRNIQAIFLERGGERFKLPENNLQAARAMARHMYNGGDIYDSIGEGITQLASDYRKLREFIRYTNKSKMVNEDNAEYIAMVKENVAEIRNMFHRLKGAKTYATAVESLEHYASAELNEDDAEDFANDIKSKFTETHFDQRVENVIGNLHNLVSRKRAFENAIQEAITKENFSSLKSMLSEDLVDFADPRARLGHQIGVMSNSATDERLKNYLSSISQKLNSGGNLGQFEYNTVKSCLMSASQPQLKPPTGNNMAESYSRFLDQFLID